MSNTTMPNESYTPGIPGCFCRVCNWRRTMDDGTWRCGQAASPASYAPFVVEEFGCSKGQHNGAGLDEPELRPWEKTQYWIALVGMMETENTKLKTECDRYRAALEEVLEQIGTSGGFPPDMTIKAIENIADRALHPEEGE